MGWVVWLQDEVSAGKRDFLWATWTCRTGESGPLSGTQTSHHPSTPGCGLLETSRPEAWAHTGSLSPRLQLSSQIRGATWENTARRSRTLPALLLGNSSWMEQTHNTWPSSHSSLGVHTAVRMLAHNLSRQSCFLLWDGSHAFWLHHLLLNCPQSQYQLTLLRKATAECQLKIN